MPWFPTKAKISLAIVAQSFLRAMHKFREQHTASTDDITRTPVLRHCLY